MVHQNDILELSKRLKNGERARVVLIVVCVILLFASIILITCYIVMKNKYFTSYELCETDFCMRSSANLRLAMNTSVDPCDNFYKFSCDRWTSEHPDHGWFSPVSAFTMVAESVTADVLKFFQTKPSKDEPIPVKQSRDLFVSCLDQEARDKLGYSPVFKYLSLLELPKIPTIMKLTEKNGSETETFNWIKTEALAIRITGTQMFIGFSVMRNNSNTSDHFMILGAPPFIHYSLPRLWKPSLQRNYKNIKKAKEETEENTETPEEEEEVDPEYLTKIFRRFYVYITTTILKAHFTEEGSIPENLEEVVNNTTDIIMEIKSDFEKFSDVLDNNSTNTTFSDSNTILTVNELQELTDSYLESINLTKIDIWKPYLEIIFNNLNVTINYEKNDIFVMDDYDILYIKEILKYISNLSDEKIELWMWWQVVSRFTPYTTSEIDRFFEDLLEKSLFDQPRPLKCISIVDEYMGMAVSYAIADKIVLNDTRIRVNNMIQDIKNAFKQRVRNLKWMDPKTKELTLEKCNAMLTFTGYPDWLMKDGALENFYSNLTISNNTYLDNILNIIQKNVRTDLEMLHSGHLREWPTNTYPIEANAYHVPWDNSIVVPTAFLLFPLYNLGLEVLNYAATGCTLGHELIHGFDDEGRKYDKTGNLIQWWDEDTIEKFEELAQCFVDQYNQFYVPQIEQFVDGKVSLGENIADNDGLRLAYIAYQNYKKRNKKEPKLPGLEKYSEDQMFFIAYASTWCDEVESDNKAYDVQETHCPKIFRLIGSLQNSKEFARAFNCPKGSNMNPEKKCSIW